MASSGRGPAASGRAIALVLLLLASTTAALTLEPAHPPISNGAPSTEDAPVLAVPPPAAAGRAPSYDAVHNGSGYHVVATGAGWDAAQAAALLDGGRLAVIDDPAEHATIQALLLATAPTTSAPGMNGTAFVWLGANDTASEGRFTWLDGTHLPTASTPADGGLPWRDHQPWAAGRIPQPDDAGGNEDCLALALGTFPAADPDPIGVAGTFADLPCGTALAAVVEYDRLNRTTTLAGGQSSVAATLDPTLTSSIDHHDGGRWLETTLTIDGTARAEWANRTYTPGALNGTPVGNGSQNGSQNGTWIDPGNQQRTLARSPGPGVPNAGVSNLTLAGTVNWGGDHAYHILHLTCVTQSQCAHVRVQGNLTIHAHRIIIDDGARITADGQHWGENGTAITMVDNGTPVRGAGGGGHVGAGGSGASQAGYGSPNGGTAYPDADVGGSGGNISYRDQANRPRVRAGGFAGGLINLYADEMLVAGEVSAAGATGQTGLFVNGGSHGMDGAGGGSGGTIRLQADLITVNTTARLSVRGGSGGNGAPASQAQFGGNHHGGNGGGGGGAGRILITSMPGALTLPPTVIDVFGGQGGAGGAPVGNGVRGANGDSGGNGSTTTSTFVGYRWGDHVANGTWTSPILGQAGDPLRETGWAWTTTVPNSTSLALEVRWSLDGGLWTPWIDAAVSNASTPRWSQVQFRATFSTTDASVSASLGELVLEGMRWRSPSSLNATVGGDDGGIELRSGADRPEVGTHGLWSATIDGGTVRVPLGASAAADAVLHLVGDGSVTEVLGQTVSLDLASHGVLGVDVVVPQANVTAWLSQAPTRWDGLHGWQEAGLLNGTNWSASWVDLPLQAVHVVQPSAAGWAADQGGWVRVRGASVPFNVSLDAGPHPLSISVEVGWIDDLAPLLEEAQVLINGGLTTRVHQLEQIRLQVSTLRAESDLEVRITWLREVNGSWIDDGQPLVPNRLAWDVAREHWWITADSSWWPPQPGQWGACYQMVDSVGNARWPDGTCTVPDATFELVRAWPVLDEPRLEAADGGSLPLEPGETLLLTTTVREDREDLHLTATFVRQDDATERRVVPLHWNASSTRYEALWTAWRGDLGAWDVSFDLLDLVQDEGGAAHSLPFEVVDATGGQVTEVGAEQLVESTTWQFSGRWVQPFGEDPEARLTIEDANGSLVWSTALAPFRAPTPLVTPGPLLVLGADEFAGRGASQPALGALPRLETMLDDRYGDVTVIDGSSPGASMTQFSAQVASLTGAAPELVLIAPWQDLRSSDMSTLTTGLDGLLDDLAPLNATVLLLRLQIDRGDICRGSVTLDCLTRDEVARIRSLNAVLDRAAVARDGVEAIGIVDSRFSAPSHHTAPDELSDAGHLALAESLLDHVANRWDEAPANQTASTLIDLAGWAYGNHTARLTVTGDGGEVYLPVVSGADQQRFERVPPPPPVIPPVLSVAWSAPDDLSQHAGAGLNVTLLASCEDGCPLELELLGLGPGGAGFRVSATPLNATPLDLELVPTRSGTWRVTATVWSNGSDSAPVSAVLTFGIVLPDPPAPRLVLTAECTATLDAETSTTEDWTIRCPVRNDGDADGLVRVTLLNHLVDVDCPASVVVEVGEATELTCHWPAVVATDSGRASVAFSLEQRRAEGDAWIAFESLLAVAFEIGDTGDSGAGDGVIADVLGSEGARNGIIGVAALVIVSLLSGLAIVTWLRGRAQQAALTRVESHEGLPAGGEYSLDEGWTIYTTPDGHQWKQMGDGAFERDDHERPPLPAED